MPNIHHNKILILDFGSQYTQLIARRVREIGVYCELVPYDVNPHFIEKFNPNGIILSGGPDTVSKIDSARAPNIVFDLNIPILGICYGMQTMAVQLGGEARSAKKAEFGFAKIRARNHSKLLVGIEDEINSQGHGLLDVWMSHGIEVTKLPEGFELIASTDNCPIAGFANNNKNYFGLQFHPEVTHTKQGTQILERFITTICQCEKKWTTDNIIDDLLKKIKSISPSLPDPIRRQKEKEDKWRSKIDEKASWWDQINLFVSKGSVKFGEMFSIMDMLSWRYVV